MHGSSDPDVTIRRAGPGDAEPVRAALGRTIVLPPPAEEDPCDRVWIAGCGDEPVVGLVGLRLKGNHSGEIHDLWVSPERRGRGVGVKLMQACLGYCRDHGVLKTLLEVEGDQTAAIQLFEKVGFLLARSRKGKAGERLEFYMDLYRDDSQPDD